MNTRKAAFLTEFVGKFVRKYIKYCCVFYLKLFILLFGFVTQWLYQISIKITIARNERPELLTTKLEVVALIWLVFSTIATPIYGNYFLLMTTGSESPLCSRKIIFHASNLTTVAPIRTRFY